MIKRILFVIFFFFYKTCCPSIVSSQEIQTNLLEKFSPRIASIKTSRANLRSGPGKDYPIKWIYVKKKWPLKIIDQLDHWRKINTINNVNGWFHKSQLSGKKTILIIYHDYLRKKPKLDSKKIALLKKRLIVDIIKCKVYWCKIEIKERRFSGWYVKNYLWGSGLIRID